MNTRFTFTPTTVSTAVRGVAAAAALCCASLASAQVTGPTTVTLYGLVDVGVTRVSGLKAGTVTQVASGIMEGSRWGLKGNEDLGGGYRAIFTLESRVEADTGSNQNRPISGSQVYTRLETATAMGLTSSNPAIQGAYNAARSAVFGAPGVSGLLNEYGVNVGVSGNRAFDRQAFVGLVTPVGAILAGRMYTPGYETFGTYDIMETQSALSAGQIVQFPAVFEIRASNSLAYRIVKDGLSGTLMYAPGESTTVSSGGNQMGLNLGYKTDFFSVGLGYNTKKNELGNKALTTTVLGASMNMGSSKVSTLVAKITDDNPTGLFGIATTLGATPLAAVAVPVQNAFVEAFKQDGTLFHIGYRYVTGPSTVSLAYNRFNDSRPADADVSSFGVAYTYALSKRTDLNAVLVRFDNGDRGQVAPGGNGYLGGVTASAGTDSTGLALGVRHRF
jgi:predicted porin